MPSVGGMRRSTRVFGARVLRSGRRVWTGAPTEVPAGKHQWIDLIDPPEHPGHGVPGPKAPTTRASKENGNLMLQEAKRPSSGKRVRLVVDDDTHSNTSTSGDERLWGLVYERKRKRVEGKDYGNKSGSDGRMFGKQFFRKRECKKRKLSPGASVSFSGTELFGFAAFFECSSSGTSVGNRSWWWFACFLNSILSYMSGRETVGRLLPQLSAFLRSNPLAHVYSSSGIHFLQDSPSIKSSRVCRILGSRSFVPLFSVNFSAVPSCFMYLHSSLHLRYASLPYVLVLYLNHEGVTDGDRLTDEEVEEQLACIPFEGNQFMSESVESGNGYTKKWSLALPAVGAPKLGVRSLQQRNGVRSRNIQKRRSSLRSRGPRNPSALGLPKAKGTLVKELLFRGISSSSPAASNCEVATSVVRRSSTANIKELRSAVEELTQDIDSTSCSASLLVMESDKCYRVEKAVISLELSDLKQWFLAIKKDGIRRYSLVAEKIMRPCGSNRFTHDIIWTVDNSWKLEFPNRRDWLIFKELYKVCSDRNVRTPTENIIPVPGVHEVSGYTENCSFFNRPDSYISWKDDEVARALAKSSINYDMDTDDEMWLNKYNIESSPNIGLDKSVSADTFELIIHAFEKGFYCSSDDYLDEEVAADHCLNLERREVLVAVHKYWMKKRKQKRSGLVRVFQNYQPRGSQLLPKAVLRKKRSLNRQASQVGKSKQRNFLQAMTTVRDAVEDENTALKVKEAKAAAERSAGVAVLGRQRAQVLMENADLAVYKATMARRIAEAARVAESPEAAAASFFID
ncbi:hypothetical protein RJ639_024517 [Escallonia herrerae]|uniref:Enhancer of polycomb-like protein n=1 Tax=Escallonia herrerae TaxID=1293975 RepID=A0AA88V164_9ASTE|nr:hypothetical protein RJ639_024517 [Escallonia herrerae]